MNTNFAIGQTALLVKRDEINSYFEGLCLEAKFLEETNNELCFCPTPYLSQQPIRIGKTFNEKSSHLLLAWQGIGGCFALTPLLQPPCPVFYASVHPHVLSLPALHISTFNEALALVVNLSIFATKIFGKLYHCQHWLTSSQSPVFIERMENSLVFKPGEIRSRKQFVLHLETLARFADSMEGSNQ
jgi:hypothetical protein